MIPKSEFKPIEGEGNDLVGLTHDEVVGLIQQNRMYLHFVKKEQRTEEMYCAALKSSPSLLMGAPIQTDKMTKTVLDMDPLCLIYVKNQTNELCEYAIRLNPISFLKVRFKSRELALLAFDVLTNDKSIKYNSLLGGKELLVQKLKELIPDKFN